jgi:hypothetical protein
MNQNTIRVLSPISPYDSEGTSHAACASTGRGIEVVDIVKVK